MRLRQMARDCIICRILQKVRVLNYARLRAIIRDCERLSQNNQSTPTPKARGSNPPGHAKNPLIRRLFRGFNFNSFGVRATMRQIREKHNSCWI